MSGTAHLPQIAKIASIPQSVNYETISVTPTSPHIGAEIGRIDLTRPLSNKQVEELHDAFARYLVIFFRDQKISFEDQIRLAGYFGPLGKHVGKSTISKPTDNDAVRRFHYDETSKQISGENFHSDQSCAPMPPLGSMLYNHTVPPDGGGDTMFASMYAAYDALSDGMKKYLDGADRHARRHAHLRTRHAGLGSPRHHPPSGHRQEGDLRQPGLHVAHQRASAARGPAHPAIPDRSLRQGGVDHPLPLGAAFDRVLGQPLHATTRRSGTTGRTCVPASGCRSRAPLRPSPADTARLNRRRYHAAETRSDSQAC